MTGRTAAHTSFVIDRRFKAAPARVFRAWADPVAKLRWCDCHADSGTTEFSMDFRPGGRETYRSTLEDGTPILVDKTYLEIVPDARILYAYAMEIGGRAVSGSLVTVEFHADGAGTRQTLTEQLAYLDGHYDLEERRRGTDEGFDRLVLELADGLTAV